MHLIPRLSLGPRSTWVVLLQLACLWPVLHWVVLRTRDGSDEPWSVLALVTLAAIGIYRSRTRHSELHTVDGLLPGFALVAYAFAYPFSTPLPRALIGLFGLALTLSQLWYGKKLHAGVLGLCWLSLPLMASLEFYASYPLRVFSAEIAQLLLSFSGVSVDRLGVNLVADGHEVVVDPACSGLKMLWAGAYATSVLACLFPLRAARSFACATAALLLLVLGNAWRTTALFFSESGLLDLPSAAHDAIGFVIFALVLAAVAQLWMRAARSRPATDPDIAPAAGPRHSGFFGVACALALAAAFLPRPSHPEAAAHFTGWPTSYEGRPLTQTAAPAELAAFYESFPGKVAHFESGSTRYVFRFLTAPTRRLHPARHCYRASGYTTDGERSCLRDGQRHGCFTAKRGPQILRVNERLYDASGNGWTDVSAWYWAAVLGRTQGPWWSVTIAEVDPELESAPLASQD